MVNQSGRVGVAARALKQFGRVGWSQMMELGVDRRAIARWTKDGYLHRVLPGVYAVGHTAPSVEGDLSAAVLYAGDGAMLSHATALWWYGFSIADLSRSM